MNYFRFVHAAPFKRIELYFEVGSSTYQISILGPNKMGELRALLKLLFLAEQHTEAYISEYHDFSCADLPIGTFERAIQQIISLETNK